MHFRGRRNSYTCGASQKRGFLHTCCSHLLRCACCACIAFAADRLNTRSRLVRNRSLLVFIQAPLEQNNEAGQLPDGLRKTHRASKSRCLRVLMSAFEILPEFYRRRRLCEPTATLWTDQTAKWLCSISAKPRLPIKYIAATTYAGGGSNGHGCSPLRSPFGMTVRCAFSPTRDQQAEIPSFIPVCPTHRLDCWSVLATALLVLPPGARVPVCAAQGNASHTRIRRLIIVADISAMSS